MNDNVMLSGTMALIAHGYFLSPDAMHSADYAVVSCPSLCLVKVKVKVWTLEVYRL